jgi:toxin FitB
MKFLIDTCVISEIIKPDYNENVYLWLTNQGIDDIRLSVITIGEIWKGIQKLPDSAKKKKLSKWFDIDVFEFYNNRILSIEADVIMIWGKLSAELEKAGKMIPVIDLLLASTALANDLTLVTRNTKDFINTGCKILNPWE